MISCLSPEQDLGRKCFLKNTGSTCHRRFQQWRQYDNFEILWTRLLKIDDHRREINGTGSKSLDSLSVKSPLAGGYD